MAAPFMEALTFLLAGLWQADWLTLLRSIVKTFSEKRQDIEAQANQLTYQIMAQDKAVFESALLDFEVEQPFEKDTAEMLFVRFKQRFDKENGGFGAAPKFPGTMNLQWLLFYHHYTKRQNRPPTRPVVHQQNV